MAVRYRIMRYEGPEEWLDMTQAHSFVRLEQELGSDRKIQAVWLSTVPPTLEPVFQCLVDVVKVQEKL